jgi:tetratricopeptide (TPR) repeat protein
LITLAALGLASRPGAAGQVEELIAGGRYDDAEALVTRALQSGHYTAAEPPLRTLVEARPQVGRLRYLLGFCLLSQFHFAEAEAELGRAVNLAPTEHAWLHALAKSRLEQGRNRGAIEALDRAITLAPEPEYEFARAMCLMNVGEAEEAERGLRRCLHEAPGHPEALYKLGTIVADRGEDAESVALFRKCLAGNAGHTEARFRLGLAESRRGELEAAVDDFEAVLAVIPGHVGALYNLGHCLLRLGRREEGRQRLEEFKALSQLEDEIAFRREFVKKDPSSLEKRLVLARLQLRAGQLDGAREHVEAARTLGPRRSETYRLLAEILGLQGRSETADRALAFARELERRGW